jgi:UDP-N-acetylmuramyl pentapeptide phosphotransferase/UDP-N-acetylglucosamine-1-phosphate transferase
VSGAARSSLPVLARGTVAAGAAFGAYAALRRYPPAGEETWRRTNHRGEHVTLLEGPAVSVGAVAAQVITAAVALPGARAASRRDYPERWRPSAYPLAIAGLGGVAFGVLDDLRGSGKRRGLRGHLGALAHGEVTTGTVKLAGLAAAGLGAALVEGGGPADVAVNAGLIAGGANLLNLFDLRPGRAIKVATLSAGLIAAGSALAGGAAAAAGPPARGHSHGRLAGLRAVAAPAGAALALLPEDLSERAMLGDAGANALGAMLGAAAAQTLPKRARLGLLAGIVALTVASEKVSFTRVIEATPALRWFDMLGRRPVTLAAPVSVSTVSVSTVSVSTVSAGTTSAGPVSSSTVSVNTVSAGPLSVRPLSAGPVATDLAAAAEPVAMTRTERLAWWVRRRRPGRHRRDKVVL